MEQTSAHVLQFHDGGPTMIGYIDQNARWTCNVCGIKESDTGCTHLLQQLRKFAQPYITVDESGQIKLTEKVP